MDTLLVNKAIVCGILMTPPRFDVMPDGTLVCRMIVNTTEHWTEHDEEYDRPDVKFHQLHEVLAYGRLAEIAFDKMTAWSKVYVEGVMRDMWLEMDLEKYQKDPRTHVVIVATDLKHLGNIPKLHEPDTENALTLKKLPDYCYKKNGIPACVWNDAGSRPASRNEPQSLDDEFSCFL